MKHFLFISFCMLIVMDSFSQNRKLIQKSWIKISIENLSNRKVATDTLYTRYDFDASTLYISFYPGWDDYQQHWSVNGRNLKIGFDTYQIEELTDSSLTIFLDGFRRIRFLSEQYLSNQEKHLRVIGQCNGKPLYQANQFITPRYKRRMSFPSIIQKEVEGYNIKKATHFIMTFIVDEKGRIENAKIVNGITAGFDKEVISQLMKTSKSWRPAFHKGSPVQTQMFFEIKYLDSIVP
jgi:hypothetical protein